MEGHGEKEKFHKKKTSIYLTLTLVSAAWSTSCRVIEGNLAATVSLSLFPTRPTKTHGQCEESNMEVKGECSKVLEKMHLALADWPNRAALLA